MNLFLHLTLKKRLYICKGDDRIRCVYKIVHGKQQCEKMNIHVCRPPVESFRAIRKKIKNLRCESERTHTGDLSVSRRRRSLM